MNALTTWIETHPTLFALVVWPLFTAILTSMLAKPSDAFAAKFPRLAALRRIPSDAGINLPKLLGNLAVVIMGKTLVGPVPDDRGPNLPPFPDEQPTKKEGRSVPPLPVIFMLLTLGGCAAAAESSYTAQQLQCVDRATTLAESKACRAEVDRAWHVDGGVQ